MTIESKPDWRIRTEEAVDYMFAADKLRMIANLGLYLSDNLSLNSQSRSVILNDASLLISHAMGELFITGEDVKTEEFRLYDSGVVKKIVFGTTGEPERDKSVTEKYSTLLVSAMNNIHLMKAGKMSNMDKEASTMQFVEHIAQGYSKASLYYKNMARTTLD